MLLIQIFNSHTSHHGRKKNLFTEQDRKLWKSLGEVHLAYSRVSLHRQTTTDHKKYRFLKALVKSGKMVKKIVNGNIFTHVPP